MTRPRGVSSGLISDIPETHREKRTIEILCQRLLNDLGTDWFITIKTLGTSSGGWDISIGRRRRGKVPQQRNYSVQRPSQTPQAIQTSLRTAINEIKDELVLSFGMLPTQPLSQDAVSSLLDLVVQYGGRLHPDGWITMDDDKAWPRFIQQAEALGVSLAASVRPV